MLLLKMKKIRRFLLKMFKKQISIILSAVMLLVFAITPNSSTAATTKTTNKPLSEEKVCSSKKGDLGDIVNTYLESTYEISKKEEKKINKKVKKILNKKGIVKTQDVNFEIEKINIKAINSSTNLPEKFIATVNFSKGKIIKPSSITFGFDENKKLISRTEISLEDLNEKEGNVKVYKEGKEVLDKNI